MKIDNRIIYFEKEVYMDKNLKNICDKTIYNYRKFKDEFRYDGDYTNHFASIICSDFNEEVSISKVKSIRTIIKNKTSRMSAFRGDILYLLSFLIANEDNENLFIRKMLIIYDELIEMGFKDSKYLTIAAYALIKHGVEEDMFDFELRMCDIFSYMKSEFYNLTNEEDYLECALLSLTFKDKEKINNYLKNNFETLTDLNMFSKNSVQGLIIAILLNKKNSTIIRIKQLLLQFEEENIKISHQCLPFLGIAAGKYNPKEYCDKIAEVIEYLCLNEYEYEYYMDKSFRVLLAIAIISFANKEDNEKFLKELLFSSVYSYIVSKNQGIIEEAFI